MNNQSRSNFFWNTIAGLMNASEAVVLSLFITRLLGLEDAGIITIAFATANLFLTIGKYGGRNYQVTDNIDRHVFKSYLWVRFITVFLMICCSICYCMSGVKWRAYTVYKAGVIFLMCLIFSVEAVEDVFWGEYQKQGRLDLGAKFFIIRWSAILVIYGIGIYLTKNLLTTSLMAFLGSIAIFFICNRAACLHFSFLKGKLEILVLLKDCFPLCMSSFLRFYICNAPKYAIDKYLTDEIQACFGFISMPVFIINLLSEFIYQPLLVNMGDEWKNKEYFIIRQRVCKQIAIIFSLWMICMFGAYIMGIPVLSFLFHTDLYFYKTELLLMISGGAFLAIVSFFSVILTIVRKTKMIAVFYFIATIVCCLCFPLVVQKFGTVGAAVFYVVIMLFLASALGLAVIAEIKERQSEVEYE